MTHGDWPALEGIHWPKAYKTTEDYPDEFPDSVKVLNPEERQQERRWCWRLTRSRRTVRRRVPSRS